MRCSSSSGKGWVVGRSSGRAAARAGGGSGTRGGAVMVLPVERTACMFESVKATEVYNTGWLLRQLRVMLLQGWAVDMGARGCCCAGVRPQAACSAGLALLMHGRQQHHCTLV